MTNKQAAKILLHKALVDLSTKIKPHCKIELRCSKDASLALNLLYIDNKVHCAMTIYDSAKILDIIDMLSIVEACLIDNLYPNDSYWPSDLDKLKSDIKKLKESKITKKTNRKK